MAEKIIVIHRVSRFDDDYVNHFSADLFHSRGINKKAAASGDLFVGLLAASILDSVESETGVIVSLLFLQL